MVLTNKQAITQRETEDAMLDTTGKRLKALRNDLTLKQYEVRDRMKTLQNMQISTSHYSKIEADVTKPSFEVLVALAKVLGTTPNYLTLFDDIPYAATLEDDMFSKRMSFEIGQIADKIEDDDREVLLSVAKYLEKRNRARHEWADNMYRLMIERVGLTEEQEISIREILDTP